MSEELKVLLFRFIRGFVAGAVSSMVVIAFAGDLSQWLQALGIAAITGGLTGGLLAIDKAVRWEK
jgi:hypothetical protein